MSSSTQLLEREVRLLERNARSDRHAPEPGAILAPAAALLRTGLSDRQRGRVLFASAIVLGYTERRAERIAVLRDAADAFRRSGDDGRLARVLGALAAPLDTELSLPERIAFGRRGIEAAQRAGDPVSEAHCAGNLATAELLAGHPRALSRWRTAIATLSASRSHAARDDANRYRVQLAAGLAMFARYREALELVDDARGATSEPFWLARLASTAAAVHWRTGRWDDALRDADRAVNASSGPASTLARLIAAAIDLERERHPAPAPAMTITGSPLGASAAALIIDARIIRREPVAARGGIELLNELARCGVRSGTEDLVVAIARSGIEAGSRALALTEHANGARATAGKLAARAYLDEHRGSTDPANALAAGDAYASLGEPFERARMLDLAARAVARAGKDARTLVRDAAELYRTLGAHRSLARLLRRSRSRTLADITVPISQRRSPSPGLTAREEEVATLAAQAYTAREIAARLSVSEATVRTHLANIKRRLNVARKADLVRLLR